jgi:oxygen-independent coproporphyrinogen III oxidase
MTSIFTLARRNAQRQFCGKISRYISSIPATKMESTAFASKLDPEVMKSQLVEIKELEAFGIARLLHGFYYISHYYPLRAMKPVNQTEIQKRLGDLEEHKFELYYHFPFCEQICGFCHFYKQVKGHDFDVKEKQIINAVLKETQIYNEFFGRKIEARTIQFGGGTPSLMSNPRLTEFLEKLNQHLIIQPGAEMKFEIFPKEYRENELDEKLTILKNFGVTDIVVDLESGNQRTLNYINRKSSSMENYLKVVERIISKGFKNIVTALMVGLPFETVDSLKKTIDTLASIPEITVVNTFPTIWRPSDGMAFKTFKDRSGFVSSDDRDLQMLFARNLLRQHGFTEGPIAFFRREMKESRQQFDKFECVNLLGFGVSSFGYLNGNGWASQYRA